MWYLDKKISNNSAVLFLNLKLRPRWAMMPKGSAKEGVSQVL